MDYIKEFDDLLQDESKSDGELLSIARDYIAELQGLTKLFKVTQYSYYGKCEAAILASDEKRAKAIFVKQFPENDVDDHKEFLEYKVEELPCSEGVLLHNYESY